MAMPYIKIEPPEYLNNYAINSLTCEEFGAMMRVFLLMWQADMELHNDDIYISRQLNIEPRKWAAIKQKLDRLHIVFADGQNLINIGIKNKFHAAEAYSRQMSENRQKRKRKQ